MDIHSNSNIYTVYDGFDFSKVILTHPEALQGGSFFTKLNINNDMLYLQTPKCTSKQGVIITNGKKSYIDIIFSNEDTKFIEFMEKLIDIYFSSGSLIYDPFNGIGTTANACKKTGLNYIGSEINEVFWKIACDRLK